MILKVTVLKSGDDVFSVHIDVRDQTELSTGVKAALDEFQRLSPKTKLLGGEILIKLDKVKALPKIPKGPKVPTVSKAPRVRKKAPSPAEAELV
jgi:hypothetical protein